jgi:hypothetical protein
VTGPGATTKRAAGFPPPSSFPPRARFPIPNGWHARSPLACRSPPRHPLASLEAGAFPLGSRLPRNPQVPARPSMPCPGRRPPSLQQPGEAGYEPRPIRIVQKMGFCVAVHRRESPSAHHVKLRRVQSIRAGHMPILAPCDGLGSTSAKVGPPKWGEECRWHVNRERTGLTCTDGQAACGKCRR